MPEDPEYSNPYLGSKARPPPYSVAHAIGRYDAHGRPTNSHQRHQVTIEKPLVNRDASPVGAGTRTSYAGKARDYTSTVARGSQVFPTAAGFEYKPQRRVACAQKLRSEGMYDSLRDDPPETVLKNERPDSRDATVRFFRGAPNFRNNSSEGAAGILREDGPVAERITARVPGCLARGATNNLNNNSCGVSANLDWKIEYAKHEKKVIEEKPLKLKLRAFPTSEDGVPLSPSPGAWQNVNHSSPSRGFADHGSSLARAPAGGGGPPRNRGIRCNIPPGAAHSLSASAVSSPRTPRSPVSAVGEFGHSFSAAEDVHNNMVHINPDENYYAASSCKNSPTSVIKQESERRMKSPPRLDMLGQSKTAGDIVDLDRVRIHKSVAQKNARKDETCDKRFVECSPKGRASRLAKNRDHRSTHQSDFQPALTQNQKVIFKLADMYTNRPDLYWRGKDNQRNNRSSGVDAVLREEERINDHLGKVKERKKGSVLRWGNRFYSSCS